MIRFLKRLCLFAPVAVIFYLAGLLLAGFCIPEKYTPNLRVRSLNVGHLYTRLQEADTIQGPVDVLFLGSSHAYRNFDPRNFKGLRTFNLGSSAQTHLQTGLLLDRYLDRMQPAVIVYEVYPMMFGRDGMEAMVDIAINYKNDRHSIATLFRTGNIAVFNSVAFAWMRDLLIYRSKLPQRRQENPGGTYVDGGYVQGEHARFRYETYDTRKWVFRDAQLAAFNDNLMKIRSRGIPVILVFSPITRALYQSYTNNGLVDSMMSVAGEYYNFNHYANSGQPFALVDTLHFADNNHLNQDGVNIFNRALLPILEEKLGR